VLFTFEKLHSESTETVSKMVRAPTVNRGPPATVHELQLRIHCNENADLAPDE
jgi:hypothetical protein